MTARIDPRLFAIALAGMILASAGVLVINTYDLIPLGYTSPAEKSFQLMFQLMLVNVYWSMAVALAFHICHGHAVWKVKKQQRSSRQSKLLDWLFLTAYSIFGIALITGYFHVETATLLFGFIVVVDIMTRIFEWLLGKEMMSELAA